MQVIIPKPKRLVTQKGKTEISFPLKLFLPEFLKLSPEAVFSVCERSFMPAGEIDSSQVVFQYREDLARQEYRMDIKEQQIIIFYKEREGAFYGLVTLWQLFKNGENLKCCRIEDAPDIENRGFMLDISRGKVPKPETIKQLVNMLARFKYNQLQLYVEGFSFYYPAFAGYCSKDASLTPHEIREIDEYCRERCIDLVPNQNSLGHMAAWLSKEEFSGLAECEKGFTYQGFTIPSTTLNPDDENSLKFVGRQMGEFLTNFTSKKFHAGLDEPFELGYGKSRGKDLKELFLSYMKELNGMVNDSGREMMVWADALHRFDGASEELPANITFMEWGYEKEHPFSKRCKRLKEVSERVYVCPGTGSWLSFTGMTDNMLKNIKNAIQAAAEYKAEGILLTDWGDGNHMQYMPVSYPAILYCAALSWNTKAMCSSQELAGALDVLVFEDESRRMGKIVLDAGNYYLLEEYPLPCRTIANLIYSNEIRNMDTYKNCLLFLEKTVKALTPIEVSKAYTFSETFMSQERIEAVMDYAERLQRELEETSLCCKDGELIKSEYFNGLEMVKLFTAYRGKILKNGDTGSLKGQLEHISLEHRRLWKERNKQSGLETGIERLLIFSEEEGK